MTQETKNSILIIGGGLLGLSIAYEFSRNNFKVLVSVSYTHLRAHETQ